MYQSMVETRPAFVSSLFIDLRNISLPYKIFEVGTSTLPNFVDLVCAFTVYKTFNVVFSGINPQNWTAIYMKLH